MDKEHPQHRHRGHPEVQSEEHSHELGECCELRDTERVEDDPGLPLFRGEPGGISSCSAAIGEAPGPAGSWWDGEVRVAAADDVETASPFIGTGTMPEGRETGSAGSDRWRGGEQRGDG